MANKIDVQSLDFDKLYGEYKKDESAAYQYVNNVTGIGLFKSISLVKSEFKKRRPKGILAALKEEVSDQQQSGFEISEKIKQYDKDGTAYCPKCYSTSLSANKKGFGIGKAVIGAALFSPIGLVAGNIGAKKIRVTCIKCGHQFMAGQK